MDGEEIIFLYFFVGGNINLERKETIKIIQNLLEYFSSEVHSLKYRRKEEEK